MSHPRGVASRESLAATCIGSFLRRPAERVSGAFMIPERAHGRIPRGIRPFFLSDAVRPRPGAQGITLTCTESCWYEGDTTLTARTQAVPAEIPSILP